MYKQGLCKRPIFLMYPVLSRSVRTPQLGRPKANTSVVSAPWQLQPQHHHPISDRFISTSGIGPFIAWYHVVDHVST